MGFLKQPYFPYLIGFLVGIFICYLDSVLTGLTLVLVAVSTYVCVGSIVQIVFWTEPANDP